MLHRLGAVPEATARGRREQVVALEVPELLLATSMPTSNQELSRIQDDPEMKNGRLDTGFPSPVVFVLVKVVVRPRRSTTIFEGSKPR